ncbi:MAG: glycosyltransferase family 4 protein, partial [Acidobacteriales bacterium]|nr:glycosyltransferase family 4 protein [Terriglobales bacterium]
MNITFVLPINRSGGTRVLAAYTRLLSARGHRVVLISPSAGQPWSIRSLFLWGKGRKPLASSPLDGLGAEHRVLDRWRPVRDSDVPDADVVIATWWETAEWVSKLNQSKGQKVYFIQGHEIYSWLPQERTRATYRLPIRKIVISRWLQEIMRVEYGDSSVELVPNGVDHSMFDAPARGKQLRPTVGILHSTTPLKRFDLAVSVLQVVRRSVPDLQVLAFGLEAPVSPLPDFVHFTRDPPQHDLRELYAKCDVWLTASSSEGFNLPAMEAMACRTPVIATRTGWPAEAVVD